MTQSTFADTPNTDPQTATSEAQASATPNQEPQADQSVALVVGERAYRTMDDVVNKITNADEHISNIESENQAMRERIEELKAQVERGNTVDDLLQAKESANALTPEQVAEISRQEALSLREQDTRNTNLSECMDKAQELYGEEFKTEINKTASELGLTIEQVDKMAGDNPALFARTFLPAKPRVAPAESHRSSIRTNNFQEAPPAPEKNIFDMTSKERAAYTLAKLEQAAQQ